MDKEQKNDPNKNSITPNNDMGFRLPNIIEPAGHSSKDEDISKIMTNDLGRVYKPDKL